jgi:hypothetical protein
LNINIRVSVSSVVKGWFLLHNSLSLVAQREELLHKCLDAWFA